MTAKEKFEFFLPPPILAVTVIVTLLSAAEAEELWRGSGHAPGSYAIVLFIAVGLVHYFVDKSRNMTASEKRFRGRVCPGYAPPLE
jgi:hypothetical protein